MEKKASGTPKQLEIGFKFTATDLFNFYKRWSDSYLISTVPYYMKLMKYLVKTQVHKILKKNANSEIIPPHCEVTQQEHKL